MALFSVFDWQQGAWRVYRNATPEGMFDPEMPKVPPSPRQIGCAVEHALVALPSGCRYLGLSDKPLGRLATDATLRRQSQARLPEGIGSVEGAGGMGIIPFVPFLGLGALSPAVKVGGLLVIAGALWLLAKSQHGPVYARRNRRRNHVQLKPGKIYQNASGELWAACPVCKTALGPYQSEAALYRGATECAECARQAKFDVAVTGRFKRPTALRRARNPRKRASPEWKVAYAAASQLHGADRIVALAMLRYQNQSTEELRRALRDRGLSTSGSREALLQRLAVDERKYV